MRHERCKWCDNVWAEADNEEERGGQCACTVASLKYAIEKEESRADQYRAAYEKVCRLIDKNREQTAESMYAIQKNLDGRLAAIKECYPL